MRVARQASRSLTIHAPTVCRMPYLSGVSPKTKGGKTTTSRIKPKKLKTKGPGTSPKPDASRGKGPARPSRSLRRGAVDTPTELPVRRAPNQPPCGAVALAVWRRWAARHGCDLIARQAFTIINAIVHASMRGVTFLAIHAPLLELPFLRDSHQTRFFRTAEDSFLSARKNHAATHVRAFEG